MMIEVPDYNLGPFEFPRGWFMLGSSEELSGSSPKTLHYFGKDMVFYRGETGTPHLVHAYCPHMGAHMGKNTTSYIVRDGEQVQGDSIRCPFHGWRFGPDGKCDHVPYAKKGYVPPQATLKTYIVVERAGIIWTWHDPEGLEPDRDLPPFEQWDQEEEGWVRWGIDNYNVLDIHPVEVVDNMADFGHMMPIHGSIEPAYFDNVFDGRKVVQRFDAGHRTLVGDHGSVLSLDTWYDGPSILQSRMIGEYPSHMLIAHTPIDKGKLRMWHALMVKIPGGKRATPEQQKLARAFQDASRDALAQDVEIWANKEACVQPMQIPFDGPYSRVRQWYKQFYNPRAMEAEFHKKANGTVVTFGEGPRADLAPA
jgi:3-ketosteroid 9alpha-monooxygenase subunit A